MLTNPLIHVYIKRISNRLVFKIKTGYKLELQKPENMTFGSTKKLNNTINGENVPCFEVIELVLVQCNLVDNQHQPKSEVLYTFMPNKS